MKILMLNSEYPPLGGGQGNANRYLYEKFLKYPELHIDLITASANEAYEEKSTLGKLYFLDIGKKNQNLHFQTVLELLHFSWSAFRLMRQLLQSQKYDMIVAWSGIPAGFLAWVGSFFYQKRFIVLLRGADVPFYERRWHWLDKFVFSWLSPIIWKHADLVVANSDQLKEMALQVSPNQEILVLTNGIDTDLFTSLVPKIQTNKTLRLVSTGRLIERKGYHLLIEGLSGLANCELVLIGDGNYRQYLENCAKEFEVKVIFMGIQTQKVIIKELQKADIFVLPSFNEGMSNSVLEAIACGLPIITTDVGGTKELIKENGIVVEKGSAAELRKAVEYYLQNPQMLKEHGTKSREIALQFSWNSVAEQFLAVFRKCLGKKKQQLNS